MAGESISRFKLRNNVHVRLLMMATPESWNPPTLLLRLIQAHGEELYIHATGDARVSLLGMNSEEVYELEIPGVSVRQNTNVKKNGVESKFEVRISTAMTVKSSPQVWPLKVQYNFIPLNEMEKLHVGDIIDVQGFVLEDVVETSEAGKLCKKTFQLIMGEHAVQVELLGAHAAVMVAREDFFAFHGMKVTSWQTERKLTTNFLSYVARNPPDLRKRHAQDLPDASSPKKKAMKLEKKNILSLEDVFVAERNLQYTATTELEKSGLLQPQKQHVQFQAQYKRFDEEVFLKETPFYEKSKRMIPRFQAVLTDGTSELPVTLWGGATEGLFQCDKETLWSKWSNCEADEGQQEFLNTLNANIGKSFLFSCTLQTWGHGKPVVVDVNCNVDAVEIIEEIS